MRDADVQGLNILVPALSSKILVQAVIRKGDAISVGNSDVIGCVDGLESWPAEIQTRSQNEKLPSCVPLTPHAFLFCPSNSVGVKDGVFISTSASKHCLYHFLPVNMILSSLPDTLCALNSCWPIFFPLWNFSDTQEVSSPILANQFLAVQWFV